MRCALATLVSRVRLWWAGARHPVTVVAIAALLAACDGGSGQSGSAFVFLTVDGFSVNGGGIVSSISSSTAQTSTTTACVTLRNNLKNPTITASTGLDNVTIQSYTLTVNGRTFTFGTAVTVPAGNVAAMTNVISGNTATFAVIVVPAGTKGAAGTLSAAEITFRGRDGRGNTVEAEGAVTVVFVGGGAADSSCSGTPPGNGAPPANGTT